MPDLETREFVVRAASTTEKREVSGVGVPWDQDVDLGGLVETFERGSVDDEGALLLYGHDRMEVIGRVIEAADADEGRAITAKIAQTTRGDEVYTLAKEGLLRFSVGFVPVEHRTREDGAVVRTKVKAKEYSLVPFPAYSSATVTAVRSETVSQVREATTTKEKTMAEAITKADLDEVRATVDTLERQVSLIPAHAPAPAVDTRSAGDVLKSIVAGDQPTIDGYEALTRAYTGGTTADAIVKPGWVGSLVRLFDASSGVLAGVFSTGTLPSSGMSIEYAELKSNTVPFAEQAAEGDDITFGKVAIETKTAPVKTYAGGTQLTRQEIERSTVGVLNTSLDALAMAAGARKKAVLRAAYNTLVTAREGIAANAGVVLLGATLAAGVAGNWEDALIDAAIRFETENLPLEVLIVSGTVFKKLRSLTVTVERVFQTGPDNASGTLNLPGLTGNLAGLPVRLDTGQTGDKAVFANGRAIRQYDSALVSLSNENIVNLSKAFAVYRYGAVAAEIPAGVLPVKLAAA